MVEFESLVECFQVIEWKDGCIYRTRSLGELWVVNPTLNKLDANNCFYNSISTKRMKELNYKTIQPVKK